MRGAPRCSARRGCGPTIAQITDALAELGIRAHDVRFAPEQPASSTLVLAEDERGPLRIRWSARDDAHRSCSQKIWSTVINKRSAPRFALTRVQQVEHEAYLMLVAAQGGVHVPTVVVAGSGGPRPRCSCCARSRGPSLDDLDAASVSDALLATLWTDVDALAECRIVAR